MRGPLVTLALALTCTLALSGCATVATDGLNAAETISGKDRAQFQPVHCPEGSYLTGIGAGGAPECAPSVQAFACPAGEFVNGFTAEGTPTCAPVETPQESCVPSRGVTDSNLKLLNVYGVRPDSSSNLETLKINVELAAGAVPYDLRNLGICYEVYGHSTRFAWPGMGDAVFRATWIRGSPSDVMLAGDLVELEVTPPYAVAPRQDVGLAIVPQAGAVVHADFRAPVTYGTDKVITLR